MGHEVVATTFVCLQLANSITTFEFAKTIYGFTTKMFLPIVYIKGLINIPHMPHKYNPPKLVHNIYTFSQKL